MNQLHWLPIQARIDFKIVTLTYKALSSGQPAYLRELISPYKPSRLHRTQSGTHSDLHRRAKVQSTECMVMQRQLRWVGHIVRMSPNHLPRRLLYSELQEGRRSHGGQMKRFSDNAKLLLKKCQMPPSQLEALAADRLVWRDVCKDGLATFSIIYDQ